MTPFNIYLTGVGGQGIGMLSDVLSVALRSAGYSVIGSDTHGLAQRGGRVVSHLRLSSHPVGPVIPSQAADLVLALEQLEALRSVREMLKVGGALFYCDTTIQPIGVRTGSSPYPLGDEIRQAVTEKQGRLVRVPARRLVDSRLQNTALIAALIRQTCIDGLTLEQVLGAFEQLLPPRAIAVNREILLDAFGGT